MKGMSLKILFASPGEVRVLAVVAGALLAAGAMTASAQTPAVPVYAPPTPVYYSSSGHDLGFQFGGDLGVSVLPDFNSSRLGFPGRFSAQPGLSLGLEPGYNFLSTSRLTLGGFFETGVLYNHLNSIRNAGAWTPLRGDYYQVPLLGELELKWHPDSFVVPYIGVGGGGDYSDASIHRAYHHGFNSDSDEIDPAVQAMAGVRFRINSLTEVGLGYKFLAAFPGSGSYIGTHSALATFTLRF
jgi:opacity protein-like surface antigen